MPLGSRRIDVTRPAEVLPDRPQPALPDGASAAQPRPLTQRLGWAVLYAGATFFAFLVLFGFSNLVWGGGYMTSFGGASAGDHIQLSYYFWLWWDAITTGSHVPWTDPFQFTATGFTTRQPFGWPLVLVSLPVQAVWGAVAAYNAVFYSSFIAAAGATYAWVRRLNLSPAAAAVAGFAFAFAPFRLAQRWHINALLAFLLPLTLYFVERALRGPERRARLAGWGAAATFVSLTASGEMHVAVYFAPVLVAYVVLRSQGVARVRLSALLLPAIAGLLGAMFCLLATYVAVHTPSYRASVGITDAAEKYAPRPMDLVRRGSPSERTAYPGAVTFGLAAIGLIAGLRRRGPKPLLIFLTVLIVGAYALALLPAGRDVGIGIYRALPLLNHIRVPGRIMVVATLAFAALAAFGVSRIRLPRVPALAIGVALASLIVLDNAAFTRNIASAPVEPNLLHGVPQGARVLDLPPFDSGHFVGSRYMVQLIHNPGPRVGGYSVFATDEAWKAQQRTKPLTEVPVDDCHWRDTARSFGFEHVSVHTALFGVHPRWPRDPVALIAALDAHPAFSRLSATRDVIVYRLDPDVLECAR